MYLLVRGPDGRPAEISWDRWFHACNRHPEIAESLPDVVLTVEYPIHREPDPVPGRERLFGQGESGGWVRVIIEFSGDHDRFVTAFAQSADPKPRYRR